MKGAIIILGILAMGFFTAQSFEAFGYSPSAGDQEFLSVVFSKIETLHENDPQALAVAYQKIQAAKQTHTNNPLIEYILEEISLYTSTLIDTSSLSASSSSSDLDPAIISLLAEQF